MYEVNFEAGTGRFGPEPVNFMVCIGHHLYAEIVVPDGASDDYGYLNLKDEIIKQAAADGIPEKDLKFWYDGQEQFLAQDACVEARVRCS